MLAHCKDEKICIGYILVYGVAIVAFYKIRRNGDGLRRTEGARVDHVDDRDSWRIGRVYSTLSGESDSAGAESGGARQVRRSKANDTSRADAVITQLYIRGVDDLDLPECWDLVLRLECDGVAHDIAGYQSGRSIGESSEYVRHER